MEELTGLMVKPLRLVVGQVQDLGQVMQEAAQDLAVMFA